MRIYANSVSREDVSLRFQKCGKKGGEGGIALAEKVLDTLENKESDFHTLYPDDMSLEKKIETIAKEIYGANEVIYEPAAKRQLDKITAMGFGNFPVCMAKNQYSLSDDAKETWTSGKLCYSYPGSVCQCRSRFCRCPDRSDHDDAGIAESTGCKMGSMFLRMENNRIILRGEIHGSTN